MASPYLGELRLISFNFPPKGWAFCNGQLMLINQNQALFSLLGTYYGGDGMQTFALPNLQGRLALHQSGTFNIGQQGGEQTHLLTIAELPSHTHSLNVYNAPGDVGTPAGNILAADPLSLGFGFHSGQNASMPSSTITMNGSGAGHENMMPYLVLNYIIALQGIFPSRS